MTNIVAKRLGAGKTDAHESGSALILALLMITVIGLVLGVVLGSARTGLASVTGFNSTRSLGLDTDGAIDGAINSIRGSLAVGAAGYTGCGRTAGAQYVLKPNDDGRQLVVDCYGLPNSGLFPQDQPAYAILTLGSTANGDGILEDGNKTLTVDGPVASNGLIDLTAGGSADYLSVFGDVSANNCLPSGAISTGQLSATGSITCNSNTAVAAPGYQPASTFSAIAGANGQNTDVLGTCNSANSVVVFQPGYYSQAPQPASGCNGTVYWFQPGTYYFDFTGADTATTWNLAGTSVIAGASSGDWDATTSSNNATLTNEIKAGTACNAAQSGAQFILGGKTLVDISQNNAFLNMCAPVPVPADQHIALYGLTSGSRSSTTQTYTPNNVSSTSFVPGDAMPTTAALSSLQQSADVVVSQFQNTAGNSAKPGGTIDTTQPINLVIGHTDSDSNVTDSITVTLPANGTQNSKSATFPVSDCPNPPLPCTTTVDISSVFSGRNWAWRDLNAMQVDYNVNGHITSNNHPLASETLTSMSLSLNYTDPGFESLADHTSGCENAQPVCGAVMSKVDLNLFFHGTVFVPGSALDLRVQNSSTTIFDRGVIARRLYVNLSSSSTQSQSPFQVHFGTSGRRVLFVAHLQGAATPLLRAIADFTDTDGQRAFPGYSVKIEHWDTQPG